jgi:hypothetical protein
MPTLEYMAMVEQGFGPGEPVVCRPEWFVPAAQQHRDPSEKRVAAEVREMTSLPLPGRSEKIIRLAHSWPKLLMKVMTKMAADKAKRHKAAKPRARKAATVVRQDAPIEQDADEYVVPVKMENVGEDAHVEPTLLDRFKAYETTLRTHRNDNANMAYPFAIKLKNK